GLELALELVERVAQRLHVRAFELCGKHLHALHVDRGAREVGALAARELELELRDLALERLALLALGLDLPRELLAARLEEALHDAEVAFHAPHVVERDGAGDRLHAADAGGDAALARDLEQPDVAGARDVRAAAELARAADVEHAHLVAVLLAEEHHRAELLRLVDRHHAHAGRLVAQHFGVDHALDA